LRQAILGAKGKDVFSASRRCGEVVQNSLQRRETIWVEVNKLLKARFIRPVDYPSWLANPILVEKPDGSCRMCVNYTSLNKACPKDEYPYLVFVRS
jgi:hypothetical protein